MTEDLQKFGYFSGMYGINAQKNPAYSSFLDENIPIKKHIRRIKRAKEKSITEAEANIKMLIDRFQTHPDWLYLNDSIERAYGDLEKVKNTNWVIVELSVAIVEKV